MSLPNSLLRIPDEKPDDLPVIRSLRHPDLEIKKNRKLPQEPVITTTSETLTTLRLLGLLGLSGARFRV